MRNKLIVASAFVFSIVSLALIVLCLNGQQKIGWFDYNEVYNDCDLKKRLEKDLEKVVSSRSSEMDSLKMVLSFLSKKLETNPDEESMLKYDDLKNRYLTSMERYESENLRLKEEYFNQIRESINDQANTFAEKYQYDYVFSAVGDGSMMYANKKDEMTEEFLTYVNR